MIAAPSCILIDTRHMLAELSTRMQKACLAVGAQALLWSDGSPPPRVDVAPSLLVAVLPIGNRQIPKHLVELATHTYPGVSILLICSEPLIRPSISLQDGRVNLIGPPLLDGRLSSRLRALLSRKPQSAKTLSSLVNGAELGFEVVTREHALWWASIYRHSPSPSSPVGPAQLYEDPAAGVLVIVPPNNSLSQFSLDECEYLCRVMAKEESDLAKFGTISESLGAMCGLVHLNREAEDWTFHWPFAQPFHLLSSLRLPGLSVQKCHQDIRRLKASGGDILIGMAPGSTTTMQTWLSDLSRKSDIPISGTGMLQLIEARHGEWTGPATGFLVEVL